MTSEEFVTEINSLRLSSKKNWYVWTGEVNGVRVRLKGFGTWIQRIEAGGITDGSSMDISVKRFKGYLFEIVDIFTHERNQNPTTISCQYCFDTGWSGNHPTDQHDPCKHCNKAGEKK